MSFARRDIYFNIFTTVGVFVFAGGISVLVTGLIGNNQPFVSGGAGLTTAAAILIGFSHFIIKYRQDNYKYIADLWSNIISDSEKNVEFYDISYTINYFTRPSDDVKRVAYEAYCRKAWGFVEDLVYLDFSDNEQFEPMIRTISTLHSTWLDRNPFYFRGVEFWNAVEHARAEPGYESVHRVLPSDETGAIAWGKVADKYLDLVLSPFATPMTEVQGGGRRNRLLDALQATLRDQPDAEILDMGCGPGLLIPYLDEFGFRGKYTGIDIDDSMLKYAELKAKKCNFRYMLRRDNILSMDVKSKFSIIVSVNATAPSTFDEIKNMINIYKNHLEINGSILAIIPAFDAVQHLLKLMKMQYNSKFMPAHAERCYLALERRKKYDENRRFYADDNVHEQMYHTESSIIEDFGKFNLDIVRMEKIKYPWELSRIYDYGYFPGEDEIWDWFVEAKLRNL